MIQLIIAHHWSREQESHKTPTTLLVQSETTQYKSPANAVLNKPVTQSNNNTKETILLVVVMR